MNATRLGASAPRLLDVHEQLRDDLARLRVQADALCRWQRTTELLSSIDGLGNLVNNLRLFCHSWGALVERHQEYENRWLFPCLRTAYPRLGPLLDKLLLEHEEMASQTELIRLTAAVLSPTDAAATADLRLQLEDVSYQLEIHSTHTEDHILHLLPTAMVVGEWRLLEPSGGPGNADSVDAIAATDLAELGERLVQVVAPGGQDLADRAGAHGATPNSWSSAWPGSGST